MAQCQCQSGSIHILCRVLLICESCNFSLVYKWLRGVHSSTFSQRKKFWILHIFQGLAKPLILKLILYVNDKGQRNRSCNIQVSRVLIKLRLFIILSSIFTYKCHSVSIPGCTLLFTAHPSAQAMYVACRITCRISCSKKGRNLRLRTKA